MLDWIAGVTGARGARRGRQLQSLWSGYGELFRVELDGGVAQTAVVKWVRPPAHAHATVSDIRKRRSYDVEAAFYEALLMRRASLGDALSLARRSVREARNTDSRRCEARPAISRPASRIEPWSGR